MKHGALLLVAGILAVPAAVLCFGGSPSAKATGTEPIDYGREACARCRMHFSTAGFAGERRGRDGRLSKFDDVGCLLQAIASAHEESPDAWVEDHEGGGWVPLTAATFVRGTGLHTPMGSGIVAFKDPLAAQRLARAAVARVTPLEELLRAQSSEERRP